MRPLRVIVRAIIAAAIGVANDVPSHAAQPWKAIVGSLGLVVAPTATFVFAFANVDWRSEPRAVASTHEPWLLYHARFHLPKRSSTAPIART